MDNISNYNKHSQSFVARDSFTMLNLYIGIASINWLRCDHGLENMSCDISSLQWWPHQESRRLFGFHMVCKSINLFLFFMFSMFSVCLHLFRPSWDYVLIYSSEMCVVFFFRGGIFDLCKSDTPSLTQDVSSSQGSTRNFLNKFLIGILRGAAFATRHFFVTGGLRKEGVMIGTS